MQLYGTVYVAFSVLVLDCAFSFDIAMLGDTAMLVPMYEGTWTQAHA